MCQKVDKLKKLPKLNNFKNLIWENKTQMKEQNIWEDNEMENNDKMIFNFRIM